MDDESIRILGRGASEGPASRESFTRATLMAGSGFVIAWCPADAEQPPLAGEVGVRVRVDLPTGSVEKSGLAIAVSDLDDMGAVSDSVARPCILVDMASGAALVSPGRFRWRVEVAIDAEAANGPFVAMRGQPEMPLDLEPALGKAGLRVASSRLVGPMDIGQVWPLTRI